MTRPTGSFLVLAVSALALLCFAFSAHGATPSEPGPESGGLRLRLTIEPREKVEGFEVRIDLVNVSARPITLETAWEREDSGEVKDYVEAATSIESFPAFEPWKGGLPATIGNFLPAQTKQVLAAGETLTVRWQTKGTTLKNRVSDPGHVQNPAFRVPGLYSVHANLDVVTGAGAVRLRSNEQLVSIGGSRAMPRHTYGRLTNIREKEEKKTAELDLGTRTQVRVGDKFDVTSKTYAWRFTVTEVHAAYAEGTLQPLAPERNMPLPENGAGALLVE